MKKTKMSSHSNIWRTNRLREREIGRSYTLTVRLEQNRIKARELVETLRLSKKKRASLKGTSK